MYPSIDLVITESFPKRADASERLSLDVNKMSMSSFSELLMSSTIFLSIGS